MNRVFVGILVAGITAGGAMAQDDRPSLWSFERIDDGLFKVGTAIKIAENCSKLENNRTRGLFFLIGLRSYAVEQGYSRKEVNEFVDNPKEQDYLYGRVDKQFRALGHDPDAEDGLCDYGYEQMAAKTQVGRFLREVN